MRFDADGRTAWVGTFNAAGLFRVDPATRTAARVTALDPLLGNDSHVFDLAVAPEGVVYAGTYASGRLLGYDPRRGTASDFGTAQAGRQYLRELFVAQDGTVYCFLGTPATIAAFDPSTRAFRLVAEGDAAFASWERRGDALVGRLGTREVVLSASEPEASWRRARPASAVFEDDGRFILDRDRASGAVRGRIDLTPKQRGMQTMGLFAGPHDTVYGATYWNTYLFRVGETALEPLGRVRGAAGEFRVGVAVDATRLLLPGYFGRVFVYHADRPWSDGADAPNPSPLGEIGHAQHLAAAAARRADGLLAVATPPTYGSQGGALTLYAPGTLAARTYTGIAGTQALASACFGPEGRVFAGTSNDVGNGAPRTTGSGRVLVIDPATGRVLDSYEPGGNAVRGLVALDDRRVLGGTDTGVLFVINPGKDRLRRVGRMPGQVRDLASWPAEKAVLAVVASHGLYRIDTSTLAAEPVPGLPDKLLPGTAIDARGRALVHDGTRVFRVSRSRP